MSSMAALAWVGLGGAVGAPLRYLLDRAVQRRHDSALPWGTLSVNALGSLVLGLLSGIAGVPEQIVLGVGTGLCGALTTYSTFAYETSRLVADGVRRTALTYVLLSLVVGMLAVAGGHQLGALL